MGGAFGRRWVVGWLRRWGKVLISRVEDCREGLMPKFMKMKRLSDNPVFKCISPRDCVLQMGSMP